MRFDELAEFIEHRMRMSHVYQPVMLKALLENGGTCSEAEIARHLLQHDQSQIEYYEKITLNMVGRVLRNHSIVTRERRGKTYSLVGYEGLNRKQVAHLVTSCDRRLESFVQARGSQPWSHRRKSSGYISGTLRYEVLKAARNRCELCGVSSDVKALEVDHIVPRNKDGGDDMSNLQALCYSCNAMKRDRDDTDFRNYDEIFNHREEGCPFCEVPDERVVWSHELAIVFKDAFPVTKGHTLIIPRRHVASFFDLERPEINACLSLAWEARNKLEAEDASITGFNFGANDGTDAGQSVFHCHWHLIPRRSGDTGNPLGGVRNAIPGKGPY